MLTTLAGECVHPRGARLGHGLGATRGGEPSEPGAAVLDSVVGKHTKILWRMRGAGDLILSATAPNGVAVAPRSVTPHEGSTWERAGEEWGSTFTFSQTGCWQLHAARGADAGGVWLLVRS